MIEKNLEKIAMLKERFYDDYATTEEMRDKCNENYRFVTVPGAQWEGFLDKAYENRAKLELNHSSAYCRRIFSKYLEARPQVNYSPSDETTTDDDAEMLDGLIRRDLTRDGGQSSVDTAVWEQITAGFGAVLLNTEYEDSGDPENDAQNIVFTELPCAYSTVTFDPSARRPDKADAKHVHVLTPYSEKEHKNKWPDTDLNSMTPDDRSWFSRSSSSHKLIYVCTTYEIREENTKLHTFINANEIDQKTGQPEIVRVSNEKLKDDLEELELFGFEKIRTRTVKRRSVFKTVFNGSEVLDKEVRIVGRYLPVIPFYGYRSYVDGVEHVHGAIREVMDAQRVANMGFSLASETAAHSSESKPVYSPRQMENPSIQALYASNWHQSPYALADDIEDSQGNVIHRGPSAILPGTSMSPVAQSVMTMAMESMQLSMGGSPQETIDPNASGKAIQAIFDRNDMNTTMIHDNTDRSVMHKGRVYQSMASEVYSAVANRHIKVITDRNQAKSVMLNKTVGMAGVLTSLNDLSKGKFDVVVNVSKDYQTENEETFEALKDALTIIPETDPDRADFAKWLVLLKEGRGLRDLQKIIRANLISKGWIEAETDDEKQALQASREQQANQAPDPNVALMEAAAAEQAASAKLSEAKIGETQANAVKRAVEAEKIKMESSLLAKELRQPIER